MAGEQGEVHIRPLTSADFEEWSALWQAYLAFYETAVTPDIYLSTFDRLLSNDPNDFSALLAEVDNTPVGLTHFLFHRHAWKVDRVCYLQDLYADPSVRGRGVGRALIEAVYQAADTEGAPAVYWLTQEDNHTARHLYDRVAAKTDFIKYTRVLA